METSFKFIRKEHEDRTKVIKVDCNELVKNSKVIIEQIEKLKLRIDNVEETMGVYTAK